MLILNDISLSEIKDLITLKLYIDMDGIVWTLRGNQLPFSTDKNLLQFLLSFDMLSNRHIRIIGNANNAQLLLALYLKHIQIPNSYIEICSPLICASRKERLNPVNALYAMRNCDSAASLGGWHKMVANDYFNYALISHLQKVNTVDDHAISLLKSHTVWPTLSFIPHLNLTACCKLIATIVDPRWFIDVDNPSRGAKLKKYLGLDKSNIISLSENRFSSAYNDKCVLVYNSWNGNKSLKDIDNPSNFLWRIFKHVSSKHGPIIGALRASQTFIDFIRLTWLALLPNTQKQKETLFIPRYFFKNNDEISVFREHLEKHLKNE